MFPSSADEEASFVQVNDLLSRIELIHVDCELSGQSVDASIEALMTLVGPKFRGDPELGYNDFAMAIEMSEEFATTLRKNYGPMQDSAMMMFDQWNTDLEVFSSQTMREHSETRLEASRERYNAIVSSVDPALEAFDMFNQVMRDHALYLGNDFNADSVAIIEKELRDVQVAARSLTASLEKATVACQEFVRKAALRGPLTRVH